MSTYNPNEQAHLALLKKAKDKPKGFDTKQMRHAIGKTESNNNYAAVGPTIKNRNSRYYGDKALGRYQIMSFNLPQWSQAALGREVGVEEFMSNTKIQDQIFDHRMSIAFKRYGNIRDMASVWHSGGSLAKAQARGATDGYSTTVDYVKKVANTYGGKLGGHTTNTPSGDRPFDGKAPSQDDLNNVNFLQALMDAASTGSVRSDLNESNTSGFEQFFNEQHDQSIRSLKQETDNSSQL